MLMRLNNVETSQSVVKIDYVAHSCVNTQNVSLHYYSESMFLRKKKSCYLQKYPS